MNANNNKKIRPRIVVVVRGGVVESVESDIKSEVYILDYDYLQEGGSLEDFISPSPRIYRSKDGGSRVVNRLIREAEKEWKRKVGCESVVK